MDSLGDYLEVASAAVDEAREIFISHLGAAPALRKGPGNFATEADLRIEQLLRSRLAHATGFSVFGEERGGELDPHACWVVDPIDGTSNYSVGNPNCAILVSLLIDGQPVVAVTDAPLLNMRLAATDGAPVLLNGEALPPVSKRPAAAEQVGLGSLGSAGGPIYSEEVRLRIAAGLPREGLRPRISGSVGVDLAFVAQGIFQAAVNFSPYVWDNAAGVLLARSAGATVTAADGSAWAPGKVGAVAGTPQAHGKVLHTMIDVLGGQEGEQQ